MTKQEKLKNRKKDCLCPYCSGHFNHAYEYTDDGTGPYYKRLLNDDEIQVTLLGYVNEGYEHLRGIVYKGLQCLYHLSSSHGAKVTAVIKFHGPVNCSKCNQKNEYAEPNRPDGSYVCFECR